MIVMTCLWLIENCREIVVNKSILLRLCTLPRLRNKEHLRNQVLICINFLLSLQTI